MQWPLMVQVQPIERRADPTCSAVTTPPSHFPALRSTRAPCAVEGAHAAQHARRGRERAQPARLVVLVRVRHELAPQRRAQRCGRICRARRELGALTSAFQRCAPRRRARRASVGEVLWGPRCSRREGGGRAVAWARHRLSRWSETRSRRWWTSRVSHPGVGTPGGGVAHRGR